MKRDIRRIHRSVHNSLNELNITPLLDLVFVLLVIFIITTPQLTNDLELSLPSGKPKPPSAVKPNIHKLFVDERGQAFLNNLPFGLGELKDRLQQLKETGAKFSVVVAGADEVDYQNIVSVLDILQELQISEVGLATEAQGKPASNP